MSVRSSLVLALVAASAASFGCQPDGAAAHAAGAIDFVARTTDGAKPLGTFTVRREDGSKTWRLPLRAEGYQRRRLSLEPGLYTLDFEPDVSAMVADPTLQRPAIVAGNLLRKLVIAPARVTIVNVESEIVEASAPSIGPLPASAPDASLPLN
jgi:hypothetical protein